MRSIGFHSSRLLRVMVLALCGWGGAAAADFSLGQRYATGLQPTSVAVGDVNDDGRLDLVVADRSSNAVSVLLGEGGGAFQQHVDYSVGTGLAPSSVALGDFNGDGKPDL